MESNLFEDISDNYDESTTIEDEDDICSIMNEEVEKKPKKKKKSTPKKQSKEINALLDLIADKMVNDGIEDEEILEELPNHILDSVVMSYHSNKRNIRIEDDVIILDEKNNMFMNVLYCIYTDYIRAYESLKKENKNSLIEIKKRYDDPFSNSNIWEKRNEIVVIDNSDLIKDLKGSTLYECPACKKFNSLIKEIQRRSADEPADIKLFCLECSNKWTIMP